MKVNLGCGRTYKKGYLNIDAYDDTVADEIQNAIDLRFEDNTIERIEACQLIEHLGFVESIYALSEWFRVLKPRGNLLLETPNLEASFRAFLNASDNEKRDLLIWIYGIGTPGMKHGLCYSSGLLAWLIKRTGFSDLRRESFFLEKNRPSLRIICMKPKKNLPYQLLASFRKLLSKQKIIDVHDETESLDLENILDSLIPRIARYQKTEETEQKDLEEIISELAVFNPRIAISFYEQVKGSSEARKALVGLEKVGLPTVLAHIFRNIPIDPGKQKQAFKLVHEMGKEAVRKLIFSGEDSVLKSLSKTASEIDTDQEEHTKSFSEEGLKRRSDKLFSQGMKEFAVGRHKEASRRIMNSILLFRDNILAYLNMARLMRILGNAAEAEKNYGNALELLSIFNYGENSRIRKIIQKERPANDAAREPLTSLSRF